MFCQPIGMPVHQKKIIYVITKSNWGGAQRYVFDMAKKAKENKYEVIVACGGSGLLKKNLEENHIQTITIPFLDRDISFINEIKAFIFIFKLFLKEKPAIIHLNSSKAGLAALAGRLASIPRIIFTLHGLATNENRTFIEKKIIHIIYWITIKLSHETIAVSYALKDQLKKLLWGVDKKIHIIHNGISHTHHTTKSLARVELLNHLTQKGIAPNLQIASLFLGTIGELHPIKGHSYLLQGFKNALEESALPLYLFIIGDGELRDTLQKEIEKLEIKKNVFLCGHIENAASLLKAFDMFVLPSLSEGLPYVVLEAGDAHLPVIASNVGGISEIIEDGESGELITPKSSGEITDAILSLAFDPHIRKTMSHNLHQKISTEFDLETMFIKTIAFYQ